MKIICNGRVFIANEAIASSRTISDAMSDTEIVDIPYVPDEYLDCLEMTVLPFNNIRVRLNMWKFLRTTTEDLTLASKDDTFVEKINNLGTMDLLENELKNILDNRKRLFEFYDFLNVDEEYLNTLAKEIAIIIDEMDLNVELSPELASVIAISYPSMMYNPRYRYICQFNNNRRDVFQNILMYTSAYRSQVKYFEEHINDYCRAGNMEMVKYGLAILPTSYLASKREQLVERSCSSSNLELVQYLTQGVNIKDLHGNFLSNSLSNNRQNIAKFLLENGVHPDKMSRVERYPIDLAAQHSSYGIIEMMLDFGSVLGHQAALCSACYREDTKILELLIKRGININLSKALCSVSGHGEPCAIQCLLDHGADINYNNGEALENSISSKNVLVFKVLIDNGINTNIISQNRLVNDVLKKDKLSVYRSITGTYRDGNQGNKCCQMIDYITSKQR